MVGFLLLDSTSKFPSLVGMQNGLFVFAEPGLVDIEGEVEEGMN